MSNLLADVKYALRNLRRSPGFMVVAVLTIALGIGINTAIFSVVNVLLFRPLPYDNADRAVAVYRQDIETSKFGRWSYPHFEDYRDRTESFEHLIAWTGHDAIVGRGDDSSLRMINISSGDYFEALGVRPALGRFFTLEDDQTPRAHPVTVIGHHFWENQRESDPNIVGQTIALNGHVTTDF